MPPSFDLSPEAAWRDNFRMPRIASLQIAAQHPSHALICHNATGIYQLYAFDLETHALRQLTFNPNGTTLGAISADGHTVYYLEDAQGGQIGHFFRVDYDGSNPTDLTPEWAAYTSFYITESYSGAFFGFMTANQLGFQMFVVDTKTGATPHLRYESDDFSVGPFLSYDAEIAVIAVSDGTLPLKFSLESYDVRGGQRLHTLKEATSVQPIGFIQRENDMRFLAMVQREGGRHPLIWNARTGDTKDLMRHEASGNFDVLDWSRDGERVLLRVINGAQTSAVIYHTKTSQIEELGYLANCHITSAVWHNDHLYALVDKPLVPPLVWRDRDLILTPVMLTDKPIEMIPIAHTINLAGKLFMYHIESTVRLVCLMTDLEGDETNSYQASFRAFLMSNIALTVVTSHFNPGNPTDSGVNKLNSDAQMMALYHHMEDMFLMMNPTYKAQDTFYMGSFLAGSAVLMAAAHSQAQGKGCIIIAGYVDFEQLHASAEDEQRADIEHLLGADTSQYQHVSPMTFADQIHLPLLIIHPLDDPRCPTAPMREFIARVRANGTSVEARWYTLDTPALSEQVQEWALAWMEERLGKG